MSYKLWGVLHHYTKNPRTCTTSQTCIWHTRGKFQQQFNSTTTLSNMICYWYLWEKLCIRIRLQIQLHRHTAALNFNNEVKWKKKLGRVSKKASCNRIVAQQGSLSAVHVITRNDRHVAWWLCPCKRFSILVSPTFCTYSRYVQCVEQGSMSAVWTSDSISAGYHRAPA